MNKLIVVFVLVSATLRLLFRRNPRIEGKVFTWFLMFSAALLLLAFPSTMSPGSAGAVWSTVRVVGALLLLAFLFRDMVRACW